MIILKISGICPVCEEDIELDISSPDVKVEAYRDKIFLSFKCPQCEDHIDQEAFERE
jgi:uncharacterized protein YlaI